VHRVQQHPIAVRRLHSECWRINHLINIRNDSAHSLSSRAQAQANVCGKLSTGLAVRRSVAQGTY
jgi:hypothetical protein